MGAPLPPGVTLTMDAPARVRLGDSLAVVVRIANTGRAPATLYLRGRDITVDLEVRNDAGVAWRKLENAVIPALLRLESLAPGQRIELTEHWTPTQRGSFTVVAMLLGERDPYVTAPRAVVVD